MLLVQRGLSAGEERLPKSGRPRFVPLSTPALWHRPGCGNGTISFTTLTTSWRKPARPSTRLVRATTTIQSAALRQPEYSPYDSTGYVTPPAVWSPGRLTPRVCARLPRHSKLSTTDRYLNAKARPEELERLDLAFANRAGGRVIDAVAEALAPRGTPPGCAVSVASGRSSSGTPCIKPKRRRVPPRHPGNAQRRPVQYNSPVSTRLRSGAPLRNLRMFSMNSSTIRSFSRSESAAV
jgi:hypothetical protein